ncbi:MAG: VWA domain-containing protein [Lachnospiraceae bacterium]|nr:VWA domain-containing protein [Lachnospiraceae bacterium]
MRYFKKGFKQFIALFTVAMLLVGSVPCSVNAQEDTQRVYTHEGYEIIYSVSSRWSGNQNINVTVSNTGEEDICGWALSFVPGGEIYSIWDARVMTGKEEKNNTENTAEYLIRSESYNGRIPAGGSISFGYQVATDSMEFPADIKLCAEKVVLPEAAYTVSLNIGSDWQTGVVGEIVLQNTGETELYFWELAFDTNVCINSVWNARLSENLTEGYSYIVKASDDTAVIAPGGELKIGFNATKNADVQTTIENVSLFHTSINSAIPDEGAGDKEENKTDDNEENETDDDDKEENETDYYEKIAEVMQRYDESTYSLDTDGDGLRDCEEEIIGTDLNVSDTDGDSLSDYDEVYKTYTDPLVFDSAVPGCSDGEADSDGDGVLNIVEVELGINPLSADTDDDGISDSDEINIYGTNPVLIDTDGDGIEDKHELMLGFDPLKKDSDDDGIEDGETLFSQETEAVFENNAYIGKVHVTAEATNLFPEVTTIRENTRCLNEDFEEVGVFGTPVEINTRSDIESAQIEFYLQEGYNVNDYVVLWFDEENSRFVECDTEYNEAEGIVSANTTHFSTYFLASTGKWSEALKKLINPICNFETVLVVDCSKSMAASDAVYADFSYGYSTHTRRRDICTEFFRRVDDTNKQGVVLFNDHGSVEARLGSPSAQLSNTLADICNGYNTNISTALDVALKEVLSSADKNAAKSIVLISDGGTAYSGDNLSYDREILERAKANNVRIYTVAVGNNAVRQNLEEIANVTGGLALTYTINNASFIADEIFAHRAYQNYINVTPNGQIKEEEILGSEAYLKKLRERVFLCGINGYTMLCVAKVDLMMEDYDSYSEHSDPDDIPDEMWDAYCTEFNNAICGIGAITEKDIHYFRNKLNRAPATREELIAEKEKWELLRIEDSRYHIYGEDGVFNTKFISNDGEGKYEGVYDKEGMLLTEENDADNMGTYNYCGPSKNFLLHGILDVATYGIWGNAEGYPAKDPRSKKDFYANQEAQDAYNKIKEQMESD